MSRPHGAESGSRILEVLVDDLAIEDGLFQMLVVGAVVELDLVVVETPVPLGRMIRGRLEPHLDDPAYGLLVGDGWTAGTDNPRPPDGEIGVIGELRSPLYPLWPNPGLVRGRVLRIAVVTEHSRRNRESGQVDRASVRRRWREVDRAPYMFAWTTVVQEAGPDGYEDTVRELGAQVLLDLDDVSGAALHVVGRETDRGAAGKDRR